MKAVVTNRGQEMLLATKLSLNVIARAGSVSTTTASHWRHGRTKPRIEPRKLLLAVYNIPIAAWDEAPHSAPAPVTSQHSASKPRYNAHTGEPLIPSADYVAPVPSVPIPAPQYDNQAPPFATDAPLQPVETKLPPYPKGPGDDASTLDHIRYNLVCVRHDIKFRPMTAPARSKARTDATRMLALIAKLEGQEELSEARYVAKHPEWKRLRKAIMLALEPYPDAARAVLEEIGGEQ